MNGNRIINIDMDDSMNYFTSGAPDELNRRNDEAVAGSTSSSRSTSSFVSANSNLDTETDHSVDNDAASFASMTASPMEGITMEEQRQRSDMPSHGSATACLSVLDLRGSHRVTDRGLLQLIGLCEVGSLMRC